MELFATFLYNTAAFIVVLTVIVFVHEFGHYYIAKLSGVKVEMFSIGFGKEIFGWNDKSGTRWKVCWLPLGGYVKMFGDINPASAPDKDAMKKMTAAEKKMAFHTKPLYKKAAVVAAGPAANFILAIVIITFFFAVYGKPFTKAQVSAVMPDSAAMEAGLKEGDTILQIDGDDVTSFADIQRIVAINTGTPLFLKLNRDGQIIEKTLTPKISKRKDIFGNETNRALIGITSHSVSYNKMNIGNALVASVAETYHICAGTLKALGQIITGARSAKEISGPIGIAKYSGQSAKQGWMTLMWFIVVISINLGMINLFPIPVLDGGHLLYYAIEAVKGKPMAEHYQEFGFKLGIAFIVALSLFAVVNDIRNLNLF